jgi:acyl carrier protein
MPVNTDDKAYGLHILKKAVNICLDESVPATEDGLHKLTYQCDELVWEVAKKIYTQSGYKVEFSVIRDVAISRIEPLKRYLAVQKAEEERRRIAFIAAQKAEERRRAEEEALRQKHLDALGDQLENSGRDKSMAALFSRIRDMVGEQLSVDPADVKLEASLANDLGADELDIPQFVIALEEDFNIEIPDCDSETLSRVGDFVEYIYKQVQSKSNP